MYGIPDDYEFDHIFERVVIGFRLWQMSDWKSIPTYEETGNYSPEWISDLQFARQIWQFVNNDDPMLHAIEEYAKAKQKGQIKGGLGAQFNNGK